MNEDVYIYDCNFYDYDNSQEFCPSDKYKEFKNNNLKIKSDPRVFDCVRNLLINMELDKKNIGTDNWNPFKDFIKNGDKVLIKPNLVKHYNMLEGESVDAVITNFSIIRPIIDYTILALGSTGQIIVGDSPVQECIFEEVIKINNLKENIEKYKKIYPNIDLIDFRKNNNPTLKCSIVKLDNDSSLCALDSEKTEYSVMNYDLSLMKEHHSKGKHEYIIPNDVLESDVIINLPKPKTHMKAGVTASMKNFVGITGNKECVPHHRTGSKQKYGDEYPENNFIKNVYSYFLKYTYNKHSLTIIPRKFCGLMLEIMHLKENLSGSWYGNDTIWRTVLDLNKIVIYSDKNGQMSNTRKRTILNLCDMIISGEGNGPLYPNSKKVGYLVASFNQLNLDKVIVEIMGFNYRKIKYISNGYELAKYKISFTDKFKVIVNEKKVCSMKKYIKNFKPSKGWDEYLLEDK